MGEENSFVRCELCVREFSRDERIKNNEIHKNGGRALRALNILCAYYLRMLIKLVYVLLQLVAFEDGDPAAVIIYSADLTESDGEYAHVHP